MYVNKSGYAEVFDISAAIAEKMERDSNEALMEHAIAKTRREQELSTAERQVNEVKSLSLGFKNCEGTSTSYTVSGYPEVHQAVCPKVVALLEQDLEETKAKMVNAIRTARPDAIIVKFQPK